MTDRIVATSELPIERANEVAATLLEPVMINAEEWVCDFPVEIQRDTLVRH